MASTIDDDTAAAAVSPHVASSEDNPAMSSAALCISFSSHSFSFRPQFTHQIFPDEWIRGYQPPRRVWMQDGVTLHSSHVHHNRHETALELQLTVNLAPSGYMSSVDVTVHPKTEDDVQTDTRAAKRPRLAMTVGRTLEENSQKVDNAEKDESELKDPHASGRSPSVTVGGVPSPGPMPVEEILMALDKGLPQRLDNAAKVTTEYLSEPLGTVLRRYSKSDQDFVVSVADGREASDYHEQVQRLAIWFIETAQDVDITSDGGEGGYWKVLYLYCYHGPQKFALAGFVTLFHFHSPFKKPMPGIVARVCQALILPPFQRSGHGKQLLRTIHNEYVAFESGRSKFIVEINVEDPAPGFVALRNRVDMERFQESLKGGNFCWLPSKYTLSDTLNENFFLPVSDADATAAGAIGRVAPRQVQIAHELYKLSLLPCDNNNTSLTRKYRLMVKKRLLRVYQEELGTAETKELKQAMLGQFFDETYAQYKAILGRL